MGKINNSLVWIADGYKLFAAEGLEGIQVERLARILDLNKSSFYHYFGNMEEFGNELIRMHVRATDNFLQELKEIKTIDPEYFHLLIKHKLRIMFQMHCIRSKQQGAFYKTAETIDKKENVMLSQLWSEYLGIEDKPDLAIRYFTIVRDMFYTRITYNNFDYQYLKSLITETKAIIQQISESKLTLESGEHFH